MVSSRFDLDRLRRAGFKLTPQRLAVLGFLEGNTEHPSADDVARAVGERFPTMSRATVYNILETLRALGEVRTLSIDPSRRRYDPNPTRHHHLMCVGCRRIVDVGMAFSPELPLEHKDGFRVLGNHIEFRGLCSRCGEGEGEDSPDDVIDREETG